jgi:hypothetical protein
MYHTMLADYDVNIAHDLLLVSSSLCWAIEAWIVEHTSYRLNIKPEAIRIIITTRC